MKKLLLILVVVWTMTLPAAVIYPGSGGSGGVVNTNVAVIPGTGISVMSNTATSFTVNATTNTVTVSPYGIATGGTIANNGAPFGPDTSGTTTSGIQEGMNALYQTNNYGPYFGGGTLVLLRGTFNVTNTISIPNTFAFSLSIRGQGYNNTVIHYLGGGPVITNAVPWNGGTNTLDLNWRDFGLAYDNGTNLTFMVNIVAMNQGIFENIMFTTWQEMLYTNFYNATDWYLGPTNKQGVVGLRIQSASNKIQIRSCYFYGLAAGMLLVADHVLIDNPLLAWCGAYQPTVTKLYGTSWPTITAANSSQYFSNYLAHGAGIVVAGGVYEFYVDKGQWFNCHAAIIDGGNSGVNINMQLPMFEAGDARVLMETNGNSQGSTALLRNGLGSGTDYLLDGKTGIRSVANAGNQVFSTINDVVIGTAAYVNGLPDLLFSVQQGGRSALQVNGLIDEVDFSGGNWFDAGGLLIGGNRGTGSSNQMEVLTQSGSTVFRVPTNGNFVLEWGQTNIGNGSGLTNLSNAGLPANVLTNGEQNLTVIGNIVLLTNNPGGGSSEIISNNNATVENSIKFLNNVSATTVAVGNYGGSKSAYLNINSGHGFVYNSAPGFDFAGDSTMTQPWTFRIGVANQNVMTIQNANSGGPSAINFLDNSGAEHGAIGLSGTNEIAFFKNGGVVIECSDLVSTNTPQFRIVHTDFTNSVARYYESFAIRTNATVVVPLRTYNSTTPPNAWSVDQLTGNETVSGSVAATNSIDINCTNIVVNGSTSGTVTFSQPFQGTGFKKVMVYCSALVGTASYTFPTAFVNTPVTLTTSGPASSVVTALSTSAMTITGATTTGPIIIEGY